MLTAFGQYLDNIWTIFEENWDNILAIFGQSPNDIEQYLDEISMILRNILTKFRRCLDNIPIKLEQLFLIFFSISRESK